MALCVIALEAHQDSPLTAAYDLQEGAHVLGVDFEVVSVLLDEDAEVPTRPKLLARDARRAE